MVIGFWDDDKEWMSGFAGQILRKEKEAGFSLTTILFDSEEMVKTYDQEPVDILFLNDHFLDGTDGVEVGCWINKNWKQCRLIYVVDNLNRVSDVYRARHFFLVEKKKLDEYLPVMNQLLQEDMENCIRKYRFDLVGKGQGSSMFCDREIRYFERSKRQTNIVTDHGTFVTWEKIGDIYARLNTAEFIRCHNSYIIYCPVIRTVNRDDIILDDGTKISVSRQYKRSVHDKFNRWSVMHNN